MNQEQLNRMKNDKGFIAALDQSGGSTTQALKNYGIEEDRYNTEDEMFDLVFQMRARIITAMPFQKEHILAAILFKSTMERQIEGKDTADYLWEKKGIVPFLKIDNGLEDEVDGVQLMKPMPNLEPRLEHAKEKHMFGTKMRSVIRSFNEDGIKALVQQQFDVAKIIIAHGLVPIVEPEVDINAEDKEKIEVFLEQEIKAHLDQLTDDELVILKLTLPEQDNLYAGLIAHTNVVRVVALSGGYSRDEANERLSRNNGMIASFSRALSEGLSETLPDDSFESALGNSIQSIYNASIT